MPVYGAGARVMGTLERGGPRPRAGRTLERGGARSKEMLPLERGVPARRGCCPSSGAKLVRGGSFRGPPRWAVGVPWAASCMVRCLHG
jgi:hypothetical protein